MLACLSTLAEIIVLSATLNAFTRAQGKALIRACLLAFEEICRLSGELWSRCSSQATISELPTPLPNVSGLLLLLVSLRGGGRSCAGCSGVLVEYELVATPPLLQVGA